MSLFGTSPDAPSRPKSSLFDDGTTASKGSSGIFANDTPADSGSPWDFPTPKKNGRRNLLRNLLADADVPESYIDIFDSLRPDANGVAVDRVRGMLQKSNISADDQAKIWDIVQSGAADPGGALTNGEFNVFLALIGLAQEGEELSLDAVDERRKKLPIPTLPSRPPKPEPALAEPPATPTPAQSQGGAARGLRKPSFGMESDPWASPAMHKGHNHATSNGGSTYTNGNGSMPQRTTSTFTTSAGDSSDTPGAAPYGEQPTGSSEAPAWGSYGGAQAGGFSNPSPGGDGFGDDGNNAPSTVRRPVGNRGASSKGVEEVVTVNVLEEKEGMFMFQHRNYEVTSVRRNSKVIRRYSDFVWLLDCLHKRYPFRQLPLLPPKRVAINGNHIAADTLFIEKRRRGLARFANALVRHPVLNQEQLVIMFLTVPTELAVWRKQATISVQEEFVGKSLPPTLEDSLPQTLQDTFDTTRSGIRRSAEIYINLCNMIERLSKRKEGIAAEYLRFSLALQSLTEASADTYAIETNDVPLLNEGIKSTAKHLTVTQGLLEDEARAWDEGVLEDLKRQRDALVSMRDMFDRRDRHAKDNIPQLEKRIMGNESKLAGIRNKGDLAKPGEAEKVEDAIIKDKQSIVNQHARGVFIKECIRDELLYFQQSQYHVSRLHQDWSQERVKYAELQADNWRALSEEVEGMPLGD